MVKHRIWSRNNGVIVDWGLFYASYLELWMSDKKQNIEISFHCRSANLYESLQLLHLNELEHQIQLNQEALSEISNISQKIGEEVLITNLLWYDGLTDLNRKCCKIVSCTTPDMMHKINLKQHYLLYFFTKSYVWPLVRIVSMRRF